MCFKKKTIVKNPEYYYKEIDEAAGGGADAPEDDITRLKKILHRVAYSMERIKMGEYIEYLSSPRKIFFKSLLSGIGRGFGFAIGFTLLGALVIVLLQQLATDSIPVIGKFIAEIIEVVESLSKSSSYKGYY
ncbi:MAG: DUF5665 domain-containing protein [Christensenellales bacterium]|jgi:hypothetical protein